MTVKADEAKVDHSAARMKDEEFEKHVMAAMEKAAEHENVKRGVSGPMAGFAMPIWGPVIIEMLKSFGLKLVADQLPILRAKIEAWEPKGFAKIIKRQLLAAIDAISDQLPMQSATLEESTFLETPRKMA